MWVERIVAHFLLVSRVRNRRKEGFVVNLYIEIVVDRQKVARLLALTAITRGFAGHVVNAMVQSCETEGREHYLPWPLYAFWDLRLKLPRLRRPLPTEVRFLGPDWNESVLE